MSEDICVRFKRYLELSRDHSRRHLLEDDPRHDVDDALREDLEGGSKLVATVFDAIDDAQLHVELAVGPVEDFFSTRAQAFNAIAPHMQHAERLSRALQATYLPD